MFHSWSKRSRFFYQMHVIQMLITFWWISFWWISFCPNKKGQFKLTNFFLWLGYFVFCLELQILVLPKRFYWFDALEVIISKQVKMGLGVWKRAVFENYTLVCMTCGVHDSWFKCSLRMSPLLTKKIMVMWRLMRDISRNCDARNHQPK